MDKDHNLRYYNEISTSLPASLSQNILNALSSAFMISQRGLQAFIRFFRYNYVNIESGTMSI